MSNDINLELENWFFYDTGSAKWFFAESPEYYDDAAFDNSVQ